jgi:Pyrimidine dimer DNA glycosylase
MNIFVLDTNPVTAAQMQCDKHVIKMCLETAQILSTVCGGPYKPTHAKHPCTLWAAANRTNFNWLVRHGLALCAEYTARYGKRHKCQAVIESIAPPAWLPIGVSDFVQCMPDEFKDKDPVVAYRKYYHSKAAFATWKTSPPYWWQNELATAA